MKALRRAWRRLLGVFAGRKRDADLAAEVASHLEMQIDDNLRLGMSPDDARRAAVLTFGGVEAAKESVRTQRGLPAVEVLLKDVRHAWRGLRRQPGFMASAVATLAFGIGVNTAMFTVVQAVLLRPLPYPAPEKLLLLAEDAAGSAVTVPEFEFWKAQSGSFSSVAGYRGGGDRRLGDPTSQDRVSTLAVTTDFLRTLGVTLALGREFAADETLPDGPRAAVLSDSLWRGRFSADSQVLGRSIQLNDTAFVVVGVLPADFWFPQSADVLVPLRPTGSLADTGANTQAIARLRDGVDLRQVAAEASVLARRFQTLYADDPSVPDGYPGLTARPYQSWLVGDVRANLLLLFGATGLLLLIACSNLASLLLTRLTARGKELTLRLALGSSRGRLMVLLFAENLIIAGLGAVAGLGAAYWLLRGLLGWIPFGLPASAPIQPDGTALTFTLLVALGTSLAFTLAPVLSARRLDLQSSLRAPGRTTGGDYPRSRVRNVLVVGQFALSTTLLIAAGLLIQSLYRLHQEDIGFTPDKLVTFETPLAPVLRESTAGRLNFTHAVLDGLLASPGVAQAAATNLLPLGGWNNIPTQLDGRPDQSIGGMEIRSVTPGYFELMGIAVSQGRAFTADDVTGADPVALVSESLAETWWPNGGAVGDRIVIGRYQEQSFLVDPSRWVVGVVGDTKADVQDQPRATVYIPMDQTDALPPPTLRWVVQPRAGGAGLASEVQAAVADVNPGQRVDRLRTMDEIMGSATAAWRFNASLFGIFAGVALALTAVGLYGLLSYVVAQRRPEIGTRMALGATAGEVLQIFLWQGLRLTVAGLTLGLAGGILLARWLSNLLYDVEPGDPFTLVVVSVTLLGVGLAATYLPARRASSTEPMAALRCE